MHRLYSSGQKHVSVPVWNWWITPTSAWCRPWSQRLLMKPPCIRPWIATWCRFFPHPPWEDHFLSEFNFNYIFSNQTLSDSFSLIVAWKLENTAGESDCRGVLITQKLSTADRCVYFFNYKTTSSAKPFLPSAKHTARIWSLSQVNVLKHLHEIMERWWKNKQKSFGGFPQHKSRIA